MTDRDYALKVLAERDAQREVASQLGALGYSPRVIRGAIRDAMGIGNFWSVEDYKLALVDFANMRRRHARWHLPA
jgi:hypothetical protein